MSALAHEGDSFGWVSNFAQTKTDIRSDKIIKDQNLNLLFIIKKKEFKQKKGISEKITVELICYSAWFSYSCSDFWAFFYFFFFHFIFYLIRVYRIEKK